MDNVIKDENLSLTGPSQIRLQFTLIPETSNGCITDRGPGLFTPTEIHMQSKKSC